MAELKTKPSGASVTAFLDSLPDPERRAECKALSKLMRRVVKAPPKMWGPSIVGFGAYHYKYESGREGDWFVAGFSPRKKDLTLYLMGGLALEKALLAKLGRHRTGGSCLYVRRLADLDLAVLERLIAASITSLHETIAAAKAREAARRSGR
jgi:hypothetical protein